MNDLKQKYGNWACVLGAADGLGKAFAIGLAKRGFHLILVDYDKEKLQQTRTLLESEYHVEINSLHLDLAELNSTDTIISAIM